MTFMGIVYRNFFAGNDSLRIENLTDILKRFLFRGNTQAENLFGDVLGLVALYHFFLVSDELLTLNSLSLKNIIMDNAFDLIKFLPFVQKELGKEIDKLDSTLQNELKSKTRAMGQMHSTLPDKGVDPNEILALMGSFVVTEDKVDNTSY